MKILKEFGRKQISKTGEIKYNDRLLIYSNYKIRRRSTGELFNTSIDEPLDISKELFSDFEDTDELVYIKNEE